MKRFFGVILLCATILANTACGTSPGGLGWQGNITWQYTDTAMGTVIQQIIYADEDDAAQEFSHQVMTLLNELEDERISWRENTSEVAKLNATAKTGEKITLSSELTRIITQCMEVSESTNGAFDITIGGVARLWNIDSWAAGEQEGSFQIPEQSLLEEVLQRAGYDKVVEQVLSETVSEADISRDDEQNAPADALSTLSLTLPEGMQLDLGAVGKGIALSHIHELLKSQPKIQGAVISAGGSILTYGTKPDKMTWKVGVVDPGNTSQNIAIISLKGDWYIATSGDYERYVVVDGVRYHHILDPKTGYPADSGVRSVTIISRDGLLSDALSTACFVLGVEEGIKLAKEYEAEVLFVLDGGEMVMSEEFPIVK